MGLLEGFKLFMKSKLVRSVAVAGALAVAGNSGLLISSAYASDPITDTGKAIWENTAEFFSNLQLATLPDIGMPNLEMASTEMSQAASGNTGLYFGVNYVRASIGKYDLKYRGTNEVAWELDSKIAGSAQLGWDFGLVRADLKAVATDGGVNKIGGVEAGEDRSNIAVATANIYWDIMRSEAAEGKSPGS